MSEGFQLSEDSKGVPTLFVTGRWSEAMEAAFRDGNWEVLALRTSSWPDYSPLVRYAKKIRKIRIPLGPDSSEGFEHLKLLERIQSIDVFEPPIDFRKFLHLQDLECLWDKRKPAFFANPGLQSLLIHGVSGANLRWIPGDAAWRSLALRGGTVKSLEGLEVASLLEELRVSEVRRCANVEPICELHSLKILEVDAPASVLKDVNWVLRIPSLTELRLFVPVDSISWETLGSHQRLASATILINGSSSESDADIVSKLQSFGRRIKRLERQGTINTGVVFEFE